MTSEPADYRARGHVDVGPRGGVWVAYDDDQTVPCGSYDEATRQRLPVVFVPYGTSIADAIEAAERE